MKIRKDILIENADLEAIKELGITNISGLIQDLIKTFIKDNKKVSTVRLDSLMSKTLSPDLPAWFDTIELISYRKLKDMPEKYLRWMRESYGEFNAMVLMDYLKQKYNE